MVQSYRIAITVNEVPLAIFIGFRHSLAAYLSENSAEMEEIVLASWSYAVGRFLLCVSVHYLM